MGYREQLKDWIKNNPDATLEEAWEAGYWQSCDNWCKRKR